jgi:16S rRNA (cytosine967-C5)-methyltransferase
MAKPIRKAPAVVSAARFEAFTILMEVDRGQAYADDLLRAGRVSALSPQDRNLCTTLVLGVLRWQIALDLLIKKFLSRPNGRLDPAISIALRLGAFQLRHLDRIPAHAAINESVSLARLSGHQFASGMVNAVLRMVSSEPKTEPPAIGTHPAWLVERWIRIYGAETTQAICEHGQQQPELTVRLNSPDTEAELAEQGIQLAPGAILTAARRVLTGDITQTEAFQTGKIRIQDEGSQLIAELAGIGKNILDCCAAPGGKTLILAERNPDAMITACELSPARLAAMRARFAEMQDTHLAHLAPLSAQIHFQQADAARLPAEPSYDLILADVPCSGTGTFGRNPEIRHRLKPEDLARHHGQQVAILRGALRAGGNQVLYSTCSLEPEENEAVIDEVLADSPDWRQVSLDTRLSELRTAGSFTPDGEKLLQPRITAAGALSLIPGSLGREVQTDGFYAALLERKS